MVVGDGVVVGGDGVGQWVVFLVSTFTPAVVVVAGGEVVGVVSISLVVVGVVVVVGDFWLLMVKL